LEHVIIFIALDIHLQYHSKFAKNLKSSGMFYCVFWYPVPDVSNYCSVFIVGVKQCNGIIGWGMCHNSRLWLWFRACLPSVNDKFKQHHFHHIQNGLKTNITLCSTKLVNGKTIVKDAKGFGPHTLKHVEW